MEKLGLNQIREMFLSFFESKQHLRLKSASLVPHNDKSLLLINSGMAPLKAYFTGQLVPPSNRVTTCQKCIRTPDIERVGKTARHGTFFEMLGNFSFGDYFKKESIAWGWEFCTEIMKMPVDKLWVTIYEDDDEAFEIWNKEIGLPADKIVRLGKDDNFWEIGLGPCGPCSEIYFDRGPEWGCGKEDCNVGCDCDRYIEFWNHVFTQFDRDEAGNYNKLAKPNIDTGMGLERIAAVMQGVDNIFEVDTIKYVLDFICSLAGVTYGKNHKTDVSIRVITDHMRGVTFMTSDGMLPTNEGRGYVLRRLLRRAARHGKLLGINEPFLSKVAEKVIEVSKGAYPEMEEKRAHILNVIEIEEKRFNETIDQGLTILQSLIDELKANSKETLSGEAAFKLYDTYGFPLDLTRDVLEEQGLRVNEEVFQSEMQAQRVRARAARAENNIEGWKEDIYAKIDWSIKTKFVGYESYTSEATIKALVMGENIVDTITEGDEVVVLLDTTPFYAESGGQLADKGKIYSDVFELEVHDVRKVAGDRFAHICSVINGEAKVGDKCTAAIDVRRRKATERNHSTTHLLQKALRKTLGNHVEQAGSMVSSDRLRFDFSHFKAMTEEEINTVEKEVNAAILESLDIVIKEAKIDEAKEMGAMALFGEKYGDIVRVVKMGDYSIELCGGTHLKNTSQAGMFKILSEGGVAAGVRRIEAVTGEKAYELLKEEEAIIKEICDRLKTNPHECVKRVEGIAKQVKDLEKEVVHLKSKLAAGSIDEIVNNALEIKGVKYIAAKMEAMDLDALRDLGDKLRDKLGDALIVLASNDGEKTSIVSMASKKAIEAGVHAGNIMKEITKLAGGSGGGRPDVAQGGIKEASKVQSALDAVKNILSQQIK